MIDVSSSLYNTLPATANRLRSLPASEYTLATPSGNNQGGDSLRGISERYRETFGIRDFAPPAADEQGFASLNPVLERLRPEFTPIGLDSPPTRWEKLLEEQQLISQARAETLTRFEELVEQRRAAERRAEENLQRVEDVAARVSLQTDESDDEAVAILGSGDNGTGTTPGDDFPELPGSGERQSETPPLPGQGQLSDSGYPAGNTMPTIASGSETYMAADPQQQVAALFNADTASVSGSNINYFV